MNLFFLWTGVLFWASIIIVFGFICSNEYERRKRQRDVPVWRSELDAHESNHIGATQVDMSWANRRDE